MKRLIQWIQLPELSPLPVMDRVFEEVTAGFMDFGCIIRRVSTWNELEDGGLVLLDDAGGHYHEPHFHSHHARIAQQCPTSIMIGWYWTHPTYRPFSRMVVTGEHYVYRNQVSPSIQAYMLRPDFVPLLLRANDPPEKIGAYPRHVERDYCFMGGGYRMDWIPPADEFTGLYHRVIHTNYLSYEERRSIYLSSQFALAFQSDENIRTGHLSQRIFEGLAYGCIVFCENPLASQYTNGAVIHVGSREELWNQMRQWKQATSEQIEQQQQKGYEWIRSFGTNRTSVALIWERIRARFHVDWSVSTKVVSVRLAGGLGNQLFQLAAGYCHAQKNGAQFKLLRQATNGHRSFYWDSLLQYFSRHLTNNIPNEMEHYLGGPATTYNALPSITNETGRLLDGYFQSSRYMTSPFYQKQLRQLFRGSSDLEHSVWYSYPYLVRNRHRVVVLHSRQTDYITHAEFHGPLTMNYYRSAVERMSQHVENPIYLLCGDDPQFWSTMEQDLPLVHTSPHMILRDETDVRTFLLLQQFQHFIMSNSTFIWWVVWMACPKQVIVPKQWFGPCGLPDWDDIYEPSWKRL